MFNRISILRGFTILYFLISVAEIASEYLSSKAIIIVFKPVLPLIIIVMYLLESTRKDKFYIVAMFFSIITNILFTPANDIFLYYGVIIFLIHRVLIVYVLLKINPVKDAIPFLLATAPFLLIFSYLLIETENIPENIYVLIIIQNILMSVFAGIALSNYVMNDNKQNSILLISAFLFVLLQFVIFIERYFQLYELKQIFRPMAMTLNVFAFYTLYKYMIVAEKLNND
ncbi:lysoplasmalogenase family protein [Flavobacterium sp.]